MWYVGRGGARDILAFSGSLAPPPLRALAHTHIQTHREESASRLACQPAHLPQKAERTPPKENFHHHATTTAMMMMIMRMDMFARFDRFFPFPRFACSDQGRRLACLFSLLGWQGGGLWFCLIG